MSKSASVPGKALPKPSTSDKAGQFSLTFESHLRRFIIIPMEDVHGTLLAVALQTLNADYLIDTRSVVRFDIPSMNRDLFFRMLHSINTVYLREPLDWHSFKGIRLAVKNEVVTNRIQHEVVEMPDQNLAFLVSKPEQGRLLASELNLILSKSGQVNWEISILS